MRASPAVSYFISALILGVVGWLVDSFLPLQPVAHVLAILCYIVAAVMVLLGILALFRNGPVV